LRAGHPELCLFEPEIPQNTGSIARLCAATQCRLHLIKPFGFGISDKNLRRPGLDYWPFLDLEIHDRFADLDARFGGKVAFLSKKADKLYTEIPADVNLLVFGRETSGLPDEWLQTRSHQFYRIPIMHEGVRSLNLSNAASIVLYDQLGRRNLL